MEGDGGPASSPPAAAPASVRAAGGAGGGIAREPAGGAAVDETRDEPTAPHAAASPHDFPELTNGAGRAASDPSSSPTSSRLDPDTDAAPGSVGAPLGDVEQRERAPQPEETEFEVLFTDDKLGLTFEVVGGALHISGFKDSVRALQPQIALGARLVAIDSRRVDDEPAQRVAGALRNAGRPVLLCFAAAAGGSDDDDDEAYTSTL